MKNKIYKKLFALGLTLLFALSFAACAPEIHVHTGNAESSKETATESQADTTTSAPEAQNPTEQPTSQAAAPAATESSKDVETVVENSQSTQPSTEQSTITSSSTETKTPAKENISYEKAKEIALNHAGVKETDVHDYEIELEKDDGVLKYEISFEVDNKDYEYKINAKDGKIISFEKPKTVSTDKNTSSDIISKTKAKEIALKNAGVKEADIHDYEIELEKDDGVLKYEISFEVDNKDYEYKINAKDGKIISFEKPKTVSTDKNTSSDIISKSKAKEIALSHAGVKEADIHDYEIELEKDDGILEYEISFEVGNTEYDYEINAKTGKIIKSEKDIDD